MSDLVYAADTWKAWSSLTEALERFEGSRAVVAVLVELLNKLAGVHSTNVA